MRISEAELNLIMLSDRLENWGERVYINKDGKVIPEILRAMHAIRRYKIANGYPVAGIPIMGGQSGQWFDIKR